MRMDDGVVFHFFGVGVSFFRHVPSAGFTQLWKISVLKQVHHHKSSIYFFGPFSIAVLNDQSQRVRLKSQVLSCKIHHLLG